jgi:hypothetical protein
MRYEEHRPPPDLAGEIECFWLLTGHAAEGSAPAERIVPDGCVELIVHLADPFVRESDGQDREVQPTGFVVGEMTRPIFVAPTGAVRTLGVRFRPGHALLGGRGRLAPRPRRGRAPLIGFAPDLKGDRHAHPFLRGARALAGRPYRCGEVLSWLAKYLK